MIKTYIITPARLEQEIEAYQIILPGVEGEFALLPGHISFASDLIDGEVRFLDQNEKEISKISFKEGICEFSDNICRLIVKSVN